MRKARSHWAALGAAAGRAIIKQVQGPALVDAAKRQAAENVERQFRLALSVAGRPDMRVEARFRDT